jgi:hypothetical protein
MFIKTLVFILRTDDLKDMKSKPKVCLNEEQAQKTLSSGQSVKINKNLNFDQ